jgi:LuxR family maltose regulon positive regulatory protein
MVEVHLAELRFTMQETNLLFNSLLRFELSSTDILALDQATEGWVAGLQLAALSMQGVEDTSTFIQTFSGNQRYVFDYLAQEVLERQEANIQNFLFKTSILDRLSGPLCDFLLQDGAEVNSNVPTEIRSNAILDYLERTNLFLIPLDQDRIWYRYHHLLAEFLQANLEQQIAGTSIAALHHRASIWFAKNGSLAEAIDHTMRAQDYALAAKLINQEAEGMFSA